MSRRRRRRRSERLSQRRLPLGDSVMAGRVLEDARRSLPRPIAVAPISSVLRRLRSPWSRLLSAAEYRRRAQRARRVNRLSLLRRSLDVRSTPCRRRSVRRAVMFAAGIAGQRWSRGSGSGPDMREARRSLDSAYTCRR